MVDGLGVGEELGAHVEGAGGGGMVVISFEQEGRKKDDDYGQKQA